MRPCIMLEKDEYDNLLQYKTAIEAMKNNTPEHKINVYGFIGEHNTIFIMENIKDLEEYMKRYTEIYVTKKELSQAIDKVSRWEKGFEKVKNNIIFRLFYFDKIFNNY